MDSDQDIDEVVVNLSSTTLTSIEKCRLQGPKLRSHSEDYSLSWLYGLDGREPRKDGTKNGSLD
ncbi:hypothetical protein M513_00596 [Trichuris suis]|uniref:Uncharacterized protein n=1 Tax=Trichuris suis TaxID=68888 RepID=A0A085MMC4_9BILA|nr:hypothetical protein M513_00596 [Trichuris suis]